MDGATISAHTVNVIRPWLIVGNFDDARDRTLLVAIGVGALLALIEPIDHDGIEMLYLPVEDDVPLRSTVLRRGVEFILRNKAEGRGVMAACAAGTSRSVTFAVAALKEAEGLSLDEALSSVVERHSFAKPGERLWRSLREYYDV